MMVEAMRPYIGHSILSFLPHISWFYQCRMTEEWPFFQRCSSLTENECFMAKRILPMLVKILTLVAHCWFKSENKKCHIITNLGQKCIFFFSWNMFDRKWYFVEAGYEHSWIFTGCLFPKFWKSKNPGCFVAK